MSGDRTVHFNSSNMSSGPHSVMDSVSGSVRLTGSPVFDMMLVTLVSGMVLQHLPQVAKYATDLFNMLLKRIAVVFRFGFNDYRHSVEITSCSKSESDTTNRVGEQMHTPDIQSADNLPLIIGTLHYFQKHRIHFGCSGSLTGHVQAALSERTTRDQLHKAILSFIPDVPVMHEGMRFTFTSDVSNEPEQQNQQQQRNNRYDDYDYDDDGSNRRKQKTGGMVSTMTMHVDGNDLNIIQDFLKARFHEEVDLAYPKPDSDDDKTYMFELKKQDENHHGQGLMWYRSPYASSKTFRTVFFDQKQTLIDTINHFENKTGPWAPNRERPNKLVIMLEGLPGSGKTGSIKSIASMTKRHILTINASDLKDDAQVARLFRDDSMQYLSLDQGWRHEIVPLNKRILVFDDLDCTGSSDWLLDRTKKKDKEVDLSDMLMFGPELPTKKKGKGKMKGFGSDDFFKSGPTLGGLLNVLDGVCELNGQIVILTTNHIDMFDPALYRAGRVDLRVKMGYASATDLIAMVECAFGFTPLTNLQKVTLTDAVTVCNWTGSDVQELLQGAKNIDQAVEIFSQKHKEQQDKALSSSISSESLDTQSVDSM